MIAHGARLARTATKQPQQYRGSEIGLATDDRVNVWRPADEVFHPACLASLNGKPVTDAHPSQFLTPDNVGWYSRGHVQHVREGPQLANGERAIVGDLVITDAHLISKIKSGLRALSVGYDCEYTPRNDGSFEQHSIRANHVAVVPEGRAGTDIRILDAACREEEQAMTKEEKAQLAQAVEVLRQFTESLQGRTHTTEDARQEDDRAYGERAREYHRGGKPKPAERRREANDSVEDWAEAMNAYGRRLREGKK